MADNQSFENGYIEEHRRKAEANIKIAVMCIEKAAQTATAVYDRVEELNRAMASLQLAVSQLGMSSQVMHNLAVNQRRLK